MAWYIGLMSGTSLDGVDAVLAQARPGAPRAQGHVHLPMPAPLRAELLGLNASGPDELHRAALAANALSGLYAQAVQRLLQMAGLVPADVMALGAHGQTVRHRPGEFDGNGYTLQLINGALLAERTGIAVVCDLRSRDVAAGGQGAPLVPAFHAACFALPGQDVAVLNLGGIANLSLLPHAGPVRGFDCGPGNVLMDLWIQRQRGEPHDADGAWAATGCVLPELLAACLQEPFLQRSPPKSSGRDLFHVDWLQARLQALAQPAQGADVMATLAEFTALAAAQDLQRHAADTRTLMVCGGGAHNGHLMRRLAALLGPRVAVHSTSRAGIPPDQVEALAFAWLAQAFMERRPGNLPAVTGAAGPRVLGALYPAA